MTQGDRRHLSLHRARRKPQDSKNWERDLLCRIRTERAPRWKLGRWNLAGCGLRLMYEASPARDSAFEPKKLQQLPKNKGPESMPSGRYSEAGVGRRPSPQCWIVSRKDSHVTNNPRSSSTRVIHEKPRELKNTVLSRLSSLLTSQEAWDPSKRS